MSFFNFDIPCPSCGYNLRGLSLERGCPECGLKVVSTHLPTNPRERTGKIEAEVEEHLRQQELLAARERRLDQLLTAWEMRGERFDRLVDQVDQRIKRMDREE